jgi:DNA-binding MarR family transcriptional regulator/GNAT superfamily N-acetyltransferase
MEQQLISDVRRFNRSVTQRIGALDDSYLGGGRPLGEARLLWEVGPAGVEVRALRRRLGLDSGYASRLLGALMEAGLVELRPSPADGRVRVVTLTRRGRAERRNLDARSDELAASLLEPLSAHQREELVAAMRRVERLLAAGGVEINAVDPEHADARSCLAAYFAELEEREPGRFDPSVGATAEPHELRPPAGVMLVIYRDGEPVGCGAVKNHPGAVSDVKRMWVDESARGLGLGRRLLEELETRARDFGARRARLETNHNLVEAIALYRSVGYREVPAFNDEPYADLWFEKEL